MGRSQVVRQRVLALSSEGSNPSASVSNLNSKHGEVSEWPKELDC